MSSFHVYIERPRSSAPGAVTALARAISEHYGIPVAELEKRLGTRRFRVKSNVDRATADTYAHDLARLGAVCTIISAEAEPGATASPVSLPRVDRVAVPDRPASVPPAARVPAAAIEVPARPAAVTPPSSARPAAPPAASAAAAASRAGPVAQDLGALSGDFPLTLSMLDGVSEDESRASRSTKLPASFAPPGPESVASASRKIQLPASFGPEPEDDDDSADVDLADEAPVDVFDPFAPPEAQGNAPELMLDVEPKPRKSKPISIAPPPREPMHAPPPPPPATMAIPSSLPAHATPLPPPAPRAAGWKPLLRDEGIRLIAGAVIAVVAGAVPALVIGSVRERAAFAAIDTQLEARQAEIHTREAWDGLDHIRAGYADRKQAERLSIALTSLLIWAAIGGGVTWLWFRKIDWDRVLR